MPVSAAPPLIPVLIRLPEGPWLRGILHLPEAASRPARREAAILLPGLVGTRAGPHRILHDLACRLARQGIPVLRCDPAGSGYKRQPRQGR